MAAARTSDTDPLIVAMLPIPGLSGRLGLIPCPGARDPTTTPPLLRDLDADLDVVAAQGAACLATLTPSAEMVLLGLPAAGLGATCALRGIAWLHLPIRDMDTPDAAFEQVWRVAGPELHARLRGDQTVVIHCRAGLGRTGMVAARLLVELGLAVDDAMLRVRAIRPGAIETVAQERHLAAVAARL